MPLMSMVEKQQLAIVCSRGHMGPVLFSSFLAGGGGGGHTFLYPNPRQQWKPCSAGDYSCTLFLAHLSRRLKWAIAVHFHPSSVVRRASCVVRRASCVNFLHFHLLLENAWLDFNQTWQESSLGVGDSTLFKSYVWPPWGPRGRAPKGQSHANFKHLLLQIQKENGEVI